MWQRSPNASHLDTCPSRCPMTSSLLTVERHVLQLLCVRLRRLRARSGTPHNHPAKEMITPFSQCFVNAAITAPAALVIAACMSAWSSSRWASCRRVPLHIIYMLYMLLILLVTILLQPFRGASEERSPAVLRRERCPAYRPPAARVLMISRPVQACSPRDLSRTLSAATSKCALSPPPPPPSPSPRPSRTGESQQNKPFLKPAAV